MLFVKRIDELIKIFDITNAQDANSNQAIKDYETLDNRSDGWFAVQAPFSPLPSPLPTSILPL